MDRISLFNDSFQNWKGYGIPQAQLILTDIPYCVGEKAYGFEIVKEYVRGFYEKLYPLISENMFVAAEREEKKERQLELFGA